MSTNINPETLRQLRKNLKLSQQALADESGVSKKTIARIEGGQSSVNNTTAKRLAMACNVNPDELAKPLPEKDKGEQALNAIGYSRISPYIHNNAYLAMQMVERCYGISSHLQIILAPLMSGLLAEGSLAWRRRKLAAANEAAKVLTESDYGHQGFLQSASIAEDWSSVEQKSIEERDIFGTQTLECATEKGLDPISPFNEYLCHFARETAEENYRENEKELIKVLSGHDDENTTDNWLATSFSFPQDGIHYSINSDELDRMVGDNVLAGRALQWGYVQIADIPEEYDQEERVTWLEKLIPSDRLAEHDAYREKLRSNIEIKL